MDEHILAKYHYTDHPQREQYLLYQEDQDSNSEDHPYNDYPDESEEVEGPSQEEEEPQDYAHFSAQFYQNMKRKQ